MNDRNINSVKSVISGTARNGNHQSANSFINSYSRPAWIEIDLEALRHNIRLIKSKIEPGSELMAVVKADAYGHGAVRISQVAAEEKIGYLGVAFLEEADELRNSGINLPIVLLSPENLPRSLQAVKRGHIITVSDVEILRGIRSNLDDENVTVKYFLKINTGMNRYGIKTRSAKELIDSAVTGNGFEFFGFMTNLAGSNGAETALSRRQEDLFAELMKSARERFGDKIYLSFESSGYLSKIDHACGNLVRIGHLLYGSLNGEKNGSKPVMTVKSRVAEIQQLEKGEGVGYGFSFIAEKEMKIAVIPMGYADGYPWSLSNRGFVLINGEIARITGRICMDAFMVDVTDLKDCKVGDDIVIMGSSGDKTITSQLLGELAGSFSYEMMSRWSRRLPRIYK